ncbi:MAG: sugar nucleotide-binding protein [Pseudomonadales bacterium]|nr:sugar nucleotide-binding protein [Pseudomonadales bacterium]
MKVFVFQHDQQLLQQLDYQFSAREESLEAIAVNFDVIGGMVDLEALFDQYQPSYFLIVAQLPFSADELGRKQFKSNIERIERCARNAAKPVIFLSSAMVFDGKKLGYKETDLASPNHNTAKLYLELEKLISRRSKQHIILRTSWLFCQQPQNFMTNVIDYACNHDTIGLNSAGKGCPTAMADLARVLVAMMLQLELTQEAWGTYHYSCSDPVIGFQFIESIVAQASQFDARLVPSDIRFAHLADPCDAFYFEPVILKCDKIRSVFGIHQKTWRSYLSDTVKQYFAQSQSSVEPIYER